MEPVSHDVVFLVRVIVDAMNAILPDDDLPVDAGSVLVDRSGYFQRADEIKSAVELEERTLDPIRF